MSDAGRKGVGEQMKETVKPDSQKSYLEQAGEQITSVTDKIVAAVQPSDTKSSTQEASDSIQGNADSAQDTGKSYLQQGQEALGNAVQSASDALGLSKKE